MDNGYNNKQIEDETAFFGLLDSRDENQQKEARLNAERIQNEKREYYRKVNEATEKRGGIVSRPNSPELNQTTLNQNSASVRIAQRTVAKTIGTNKQTKVSTKVPVKNQEVIIDFQKATRKIFAVVMAVTITFATGTIIYGVAGDKIKEAIVEKQEIRANRNIFEDKALTNLLNNGLAYLNDKNEIIPKENSVEDYYKLNITSKYDIYGYSLALPAGEFNKFIQTISYNNGMWNYTGTNNFLTYNGYFDSKDNIAKIDVFQNMMEEKILELPDETIERYSEEYSVLTFEDMLEIIKAEETSKSAGGK